jgi:hypothetical protein
MSDDFRKQIFNTLNLKETDELVEIWQTNDRVEWADVAFDVIREILQERLGELPLQNEPVLEHVADDSNDELDNDETLEKFTDKENAPVFYKPQEVLWLETWLYRAAIASIIAIILASLLELPQAHRIVLSYFMGNMEWNLVAWLIAIVIFAFGAGLQCGIYYFSFRALAFILKILMEMEFNSRGAIKAKNA